VKNGYTKPVTVELDFGAQQFNWLKATLQNSNAKYKFVFSHQMLGGITNGPIAGLMRVTSVAVQRRWKFEWGGNNADGTPGFQVIVMRQTLVRNQSIS